MEDATPGTTGASRFPAVRGRSLLGTVLRLPDELPADRTLVIVAFQQWHQPQVDRWIERAVALGVPATVRGAQGRLPRAVVELPVLSWRFRPVRRLIDGGMVAGIRNPDILARTVTIYTNVGAFQAALAIPSSDEVHAFVVEPSGLVRAHGAGEPDGDWPAIAAALGIAPQT